MKIPLFSLAFCLAWLGGGFLVDDYIKLREKVAYIEAKQKPHGALKNQKHSGNSRDRPKAVGGGEAEHGGDDKPKWTDVAIAALTFALAISTMALYLDAREKGRKELRAYLGIKEQVIRLVEARGLFQLSLIIENSGKTPAHDTGMFLDYEVHDQGSPGPFPIGTIGGGRMPLGPSGQRSVRNLLTELSAADIPRIAGPREIVVWGRVEYRDIYQEGHHVNFRFHTREIINEDVHDGHGRLISNRVIGWALQPTEEGNDAS